MVKLVQQVQRLLDGLSAFLGYLSGAAFLVLSLYISWEAVARKWGMPYSGVSDEMSGYVLAVAGTWAMAHVLRRGEHVRIEVALPFFPAAVRRVLSCFGLVLAAVFASLLAIYAWKLGLQSAAIGARGMSLLRAPLAIPQFMVAFGFTILALQALTMLVNQLSGSAPDDADSGDSSEIHQQI